MKLLFLVVCLPLLVAATSRRQQVREQRVSEQHVLHNMDDGTLPLSLTDDGLRQLFGDDTEECLERPNTFPTNLELEAMNDTIMRTIREVDEVATDDDEDSVEKPKPKPECQKCCKIGAYAGKKYRRKDKCPYTECRRLFKMFYQKYRRFVKHPYRCGFSFVKCCERVHFKEMYATPVQAISDSESAETEAGDEGVHRYDWARHEQTEQDPIRVEMMELAAARVVSNEETSARAQPGDTYQPDQPEDTYQPAEAHSGEEEE